MLMITILEERHVLLIHVSQQFFLDITFECAQLCLGEIFLVNESIKLLRNEHLCLHHLILKLHTFIRRA